MTSIPAGHHQPSAFQQELVSIRQDPQVIALAFSRAGHHELAEDALQTAYYRVASVRYPEHIRNLRAYFIRVLKNEISSLYALPPPLPLDDPDTQCQPTAQAAEHQACRTLQRETWLKRLESERDQLIATVPARSHDPARYREVVHAAATQLLLDPEPNGAAILHTAYPDYFDDPAAALNTLHQRISRARDDIQALLQVVIRRDELFP
jgi:DNA-directed RNA polymerase specialized sigma24 family protein